MIVRPHYMELLKVYRDVPLVKVLAGIRRCGKSTILKMLEDDLTQEKFYLADASLKYCMMGFNPKSVAAVLENIMYFELRRKGYEVYIGKNETKEICGNTAVNMINWINSA